MNNVIPRVIRKSRRVIKDLLVNIRYSLADKHFLLSNRFKNYHVGCGRLLASDYLNIDMFDHVESLSPFPLTKDIKDVPYFLKYDLRRGIPAPPHSLNVIYHSHLIEHLNHDSGMLCLQNCYKCLNDSGVMRFSLPDLQIWCEN